MTDLLDVVDRLMLAAKRRDASEPELIAAMTMASDARRIMADDWRARFPRRRPEPKNKPQFGFYRLRSERDP